MADQRSGIAERRTTDIHTNTWEEFEAEIKNFEEPSRKLWDEVWFRGHSDARWPLHTSLECRSDKTRSVVSYLNTISEIQPAIETFVGSRFSIPHRRKLKQFCEDGELFPIDQNLRKLATYLTHLRHGGFPSPLLDWTASPYVAAYFAFHNARHDGDVAIYAYREWAAGMKMTDADYPHIVSFGPLVKTHKRHFRQHNEWHFKPHDEVFGQKDRLQQDLLWKITIPASERLKVLSFCDKVNLNEFTLFDTEEGLLETEAMRVFDLRT